MARRTTAGAALVVFAVAVFGVFALERFAVGTATGQRLDDSAMRTVSAGADTLGHLHRYLSIISITSTAVVLICCVALALLRRRFLIAIGAVIIVAGANLTTQFLKHHYFERPDFGLGTLNAFPSGHTTVAISSVLAAILVAPPIARHVLVIGGSFAATLVGASTVVGGWHRPSDVVSALAVSLSWACLVALAVGISHRPQTEGLVPSTLLALGGAAAAGIFLIALGVRPTNGLAGFGEAAIILGAIGATTALTVGVFARLVPR